MTARVRDRLLAAAPHLVFAALTALTWRRWVFPFQDHGREMNLPLRLVRGEVLYRDASTYYGPLPPLLDALALRLLGHSLDALFAVRLLVALAGIAALHRLLRRIADPPAAAAVASFVVACCFFCYGSAWAFPYSVAALEGTVGVWWALELSLSAAGPAGALGAALVGGLAAGAKVEMLPAAIAAVVLGLAFRRPARETIGAAALAGTLAAAAWGIPVLLFGTGTLTRHGFLVALHEPAPWRTLHRIVFLGGMEARDFLAGGYLLALLPSLAFLGSSLLLLTLLARAGRRWAPAAALALGLLGAAIPHDEEIDALLPLAVGIGVVAVVRALRARGSSGIPAEAALAVPMLLAVARQPFLLRIPAYGAFAWPLALGVALAWLTRRPLFSRGIGTAFVIGLLLAQVADRARERAAIPMARVDLPHVSIDVPVEAAGLVTAADAAIRRLTPEGAWVAGFPEAGLLLFSTGRRTPFSDEQFFPGCQSADSEDEMIRRLGERPLALAFQTNQPMGSLGAGEFRAGLLDRFFRAFDERMRPAGTIGDPREPIRHLGTATALIVYVPRRTGE